MAKLPSITIVTAVFNAAATIEEALASVRAQDYLGEVEHLIVDGGSTDGTVEILERSPGIRYVSEPDGGRADAVNKGVAMAGGEVIGWLNADDMYEPGALAAAGEALAAAPHAQWVTGYCRIVDGAGSEIRKGVTAYKNLFLRHYSYGLYLTQNFVSDPATFVRRGALRDVGELDQSLAISHDYDLWLRVGRRGDPVVLRRYLSNFRMVEGTLSMSSFERQFAEHAECARRHGQGHRVAVAVNALTSKAIVIAYRAMRGLRRRHRASA